MMENIYLLISFVFMVSMVIWNIKNRINDAYKKGLNDGIYQGRQEMINEYEYKKPWLTTDNYNGIWR